jgi:hypothetical protein
MNIAVELAGASCELSSTKESTMFTFTAPGVQEINEFVLSKRAFVVFSKCKFSFIIMLNDKNVLHQNTF